MPPCLDQLALMQHILTVTGPTTLQGAHRCSESEQPFRTGRGASGERRRAASGAQAHAAQPTRQLSPVRLAWCLECLQKQQKTYLNGF